MLKSKVIPSAARLFLLISVAFLVAAVPSVEADGDSLFADVSRSVAHIGTGDVAGSVTRVDWLGTGFLVDEDCLVVTAKHVLEDIDESELLVRFIDPDDLSSVGTFAARVVYRVDGEDLAFLRLRGSVGRGACADKRFRVLPLASRSKAEDSTGSAVSVIGFPAIEGQQASDIPIIRSGQVSSALLTWNEQSMLLLDMIGVPGFSGAPVYWDDEGEAIGVIFGPGRTPREYGFLWAMMLTNEDLERIKTSIKKQQKR